MPRGLRYPEKLLRTTITMPVSVERRITELMLLLRLSRSETITYLIDREYDRRQAEIGRLREIRAANFDVEEQ
jgi:hypothetical protein